MHQISLLATKSAKTPILSIQADKEVLQDERDTFGNVLLGQLRDMGIPTMYAEELSPYPIFLPRDFLEALNRFQNVLAIAVINIVDRWWEDSDADFPRRMPLEPHEEDVLKWASEMSKKRLMPLYKNRPMHWRPDVLIPEPLDSTTPRRWQICEINARSTFNSMLRSAFLYEAISASKTLVNQGLAVASTQDEMLDSLFSLFNPRLPIHVIWHQTVDYPIETFCSLYKERTGIEPRVIHASDLRIVSDSTSPMGHILCCVGPSPHKDQKSPSESPIDAVKTSENLERVYQAGLQLYHQDYSELSPEILQHLAVIGVCDLRNIFLVSDKRMLGIIRQEIDSLVHKHKVLTPDQAEILRRGIIPTILPGSPEIAQLLRQSRDGTVSKDSFLLKPFRGHRGVGILLGKDLAKEEWESILEELQTPGNLSVQRSFIVQPFVEQSFFDLKLDEESATQRYRMVGTYHAIGGCFAGIGAWRADSAAICTRFQGAFSIPSVTTMDVKP